MRIDTLYIEEAATAFEITQKVASRFEPQAIQKVLDYQDQFSRIRKPYLQKRTERNVFLAVKKGALVRETPAAYGFSEKDLHFFHIHAYNCIYECEYCYLQGYFSSPDLVFFVNHDDILRAMHEVMMRHETKRIWFHAGEFSDSLALSHLTQELPLYWDFFARNQRAVLELRTKSVNLTELRKLSPLENIIVSFSLSGEKQASAFDRETPGVAQRIAAMQRLKELGFRLAVHLDPVIYSENLVAEFTLITQQLEAMIGFNNIAYISLGVVRFAKDVYKEAKANYPTSQLFARQFIQGSDGKMRYPRPFRIGILESIRTILKKHGCPEEKIYFCME